MVRATASDARQYGGIGPESSPSTPDPSAYAAQQRRPQSEGFAAQAVIQAEQGPLPRSSLGLVTYHGRTPGLWLSSCHGGAGASTLAALIADSVSAGRYWPTPAPAGRSHVLLVARSHAAGLCAAQAAVAQWAAGGLPSVQLVGLAVVADAPGKRPKPLADLLRLIAGGLPQLWDLPWVEAFRLGDPPDSVRLPSAYARLVRDMSGLAPV
ncbi:hypothetical protein SAMN06265355_102116 [Actinomadura mexicana]|uniref:Uncharacterized protein n=1 Tax=Actinomadura mexicana TaxID=134959 RepID=A0A238VNK6_9ACTN|nr:hypothetical protein SAMN06265355_102116 [Actinomadura mexicana]